MYIVVIIIIVTIIATFPVSGFSGDLPTCSSVLYILHEAGMLQ